MQNIPKRSRFAKTKNANPLDLSIIPISLIRNSRGNGDICNYSLQELSSYLESIGEKPFRAKQILEWIYKKNVKGFGSMTNLSMGLRERLQKDFMFPALTLLKQSDSSDGTIKFLFALTDREKIETVLIPTPKRTTVCVSTQAGCKFGCKFCASGVGGWKRDLSCAEILSQILYAKEVFKKRTLSHVVFMGTGEPLDNYDNVIKAIRIINSKEGFHIAARRITISTCGLVPQIKQLAREGLQVELSISLHGYNEASRRKLMPVHKKYSLAELGKACRDYCKATNRQITFEYILIKDVTCVEEAARELAQLLRGLICKLNLIPYNKVIEFDYEPPTRRAVLHFKQELDRYGIHATIRSPRGQDVAAACGQLRNIS